MCGRGFDAVVTAWRLSFAVMDGGGRHCIDLFVARREGHPKSGAVVGRVDASHEIQHWLERCRSLLRIINGVTLARTASPQISTVTSAPSASTASCWKSALGAQVVARHHENHNQIRPNSCRSTRTPAELPCRTVGACCDTGRAGRGALNGRGRSPLRRAPPPRDVLQRRVLPALTPLISFLLSPCKSTA